MLAGQYLSWFQKSNSYINIVIFSLIAKSWFQWKPEKADELCFPARPKESPENPVNNQYFRSRKSKASASFSQRNEWQLLYPLSLESQVWEPAQRGLLLCPAGQEYTPSCSLHTRRDGGHAVQAERRLLVSPAAAGAQVGAYPDDGKQTGAKADAMLTAHRCWYGRNQQNWQICTDFLPGVLWCI